MEDHAEVLGDHLAMVSGRPVLDTFYLPKELVITLWNESYMYDDS